MKKSVLSLIVGAAITIAPMTASALSPMSTDSLKDATGQAGVSIAIDDITLYQSIGATTYTDTDGLSGDASDAASIVIGGKTTFTTLRAILDGTNRGGFLANAYGDMLAGINDYAGTREGAGTIHIAPLSIDVSSRVNALSDGLMYNNLGLHSRSSDADVAAWTSAFVAADADVIAAQAALDADPGNATLETALATATATAEGTAAATIAATKDNTNVAGVVIGLPTLEICKTGDSQTISIAATGSANDGKAFIQITKEDSVMAILGGTLEIAAH
ncbi:DUF6160 family protein [Desulfoluna spongiiphila]|uniref:DUF6160 family protein n=1 Tax=Desulfoluna spongiiphila TaxID=419481 RepID=UPI0012523F08|nr:DUF6160 family protein [Desulfoluna spongiiphila]VVS91742.1 hypothetical protein DBB_13100 [Desulfoluna spongiiphila]